MTSEEAREWLRSIKDKYIHGGDEAFDNARREALSMADEALRCKPCEDAVSRDLMTNTLGATCIAKRDEKGNLVALCSIDNLPSVNPKSKTGHWIPVSERLPEKDGEYLVTVSFHFCGEMVFKCSFATDLHKVDEYEFPEHKCGFYGIDSEWGSYEINDVIAWMPSPEPYRKESEE